MLIRMLICILICMLICMLICILMTFSGLTCRAVSVTKPIENQKLLLWDALLLCVGGRCVSIDDVCTRETCMRSYIMYTRVYMYI